MMFFTSPDLFLKEKLLNFRALCGPTVSTMLPIHATHREDFRPQLATDVIVVVADGPGL
jgi:hypothetical protein